MTNRFFLRLAGAAIFASAAAGAVFSQVAAPPAAPEAATSALARSEVPATADAVDSAAPAPASTITLAALGNRDGISFTQLEGRADLNFRVPVGDWLSGARLVLPYRAWIARPTPRTLTVMSGERVLGQFAIDGDGTIEVPIPANAIENGNLPISIAYSGGLTPDRCADGRLAADHLLFDPAGGLTLDMAPGATPPVAAAIAMMANAPTIVLPANPTPAQAAAALTLIAARGDGRIGGAADTANAIRIGAANAPAIRVTGPNAIEFGGADPAGAIRAALGGDAYFPDSAVVDRIQLANPKRDDLTLGDLGAGSSVVSVNREHLWTVPLPASRIPGGRSIQGLSVDVATVTDGRADRISAWLNGMMLGSAPVHSSGITNLKVRARDGLTNAMNNVVVRIDRPAQGDCGDAQLAMPAQLLATSKVELGAVEAIEDFHDFASASADGVTVVMPNAAAIPLAARAVAGLISANVPITVSFGAVPASGPAIVIAATAPVGTTPRLQLAGGRMALDDGDGGNRLDLPQSPSDTVAQLLSREGGPILWIRPAASGAVPANLWLNQGDVAIVNPAGIVQALSTTRPRLAAPVEVEPASWWDRNSWKLFLALGAVLGIGLIAWSLRPSVKRARPGQSA